MNSRKFCLLVIGLATAFAVAGCGGGSSEAPSTALMPPPPPPTVTGESFTNWSKVAVFAKPEDGKPIDMPLDDKGILTVNFDGDDNSNAYADLLPTT
ncbi:MAG TPA: hypothetical protein VET48_11665 [Steroidobacteraceae bacterium]|nr:hypothetical protein [Steroidobacteraceae bacterium]